MIGLASARVRTALAIVATALAAAASAADLQGWRMPGGGLYFGAEPPPGSTKIEAVHPTPTRAPAPTEKDPAPVAPTRLPQSTATSRPAATAKPTQTARPGASPAATSPPAGPSARPDEAPTARQRQPGPENERLRLDPSTAWQRAPACVDIAAIRDVRPTIDFEADRLTVRGEVFVATGGPVKEVRVCLGGSCTLVAGGNILVDGDTARFTLTVPGQRPKGLTVECFVQRRH